ncbi:MAG TPA: S49 family peptidase [Actinomycetales bacterium]|nr:S49 family peptidase [Actinomycetales bacterium]
MTSPPPSGSPQPLPPPQQPPPYQPPVQPVYAPPPPPPPAGGSFRRGFGLGAGASLGAGLVLTVFGIVGSLLFGLIMAGLIGAAVSAGAPSTGKPVTTTVWGEPDANGRLVSFEITGVILGDSSDGGAFVGGTYGYKVAEQIDNLDKQDADGLILEMNTPGGTIYGSRAIADAVERYQKRTGHKVMAYVRGMSASGGMYAMSGADEIVVDHGTLVGSIGVIMGPFERYRDVTALQGSLLTPGVEAQGGITQEYLTQGKGKDFGNPFRDMTPEERKVMTEGLQSEYAEFVDWVSSHRGIPADTIRNTLGAYIYGPKEAIANGLVDQMMGRDAGFRHAAEMNGLNPDDTRVDRVQSDDFLTLLLGGQADQQSKDGAQGTTPGTKNGTNGDAGTQATSARPGVLCTGGPIVLAFHGDLASVCGAD